MRAKTETPKGRRGDMRADATAEPMAPKGMQNSPGKKAGPKSPGGSKAPSRRDAMPIPDREPRQTANRGNARMGEKSGTSLSPQRGKGLDQMPTTRARRNRGNPNAAKSLRSQKGRDPMM
jgi:hypothetical protein